MMQHAMKIKGAQMEQDRKKFETWPQFLQNSMWERNESCLKLRELPPAERLDGAAALKEEGNEHFRSKRYASAIEQYEAAVGAFRYAKQLDPDWKKKGIKDETLELIDERGDGDDKDAINSFLVSCYNNLAASYLARAAAGRPEPGGSVDGDYKLCVQASTFGLEINPNAKALYRRARALSEPMTATDDDVDAAINDLAAAAAQAPDDTQVRTLLTKLRKQRAEAKAKDKSGFSGLFQKGELYDKETMEAMKAREASEKKSRELSTEKFKSPEEAVAQREREQKEAEKAIEHLRGQGRHADADSLEAKVLEHKQQLAECKRAMAEDDEKRRRHDPRQIDFANPTPEQIADAKEKGIDLLDPMVVKELQRLQEENFSEDGLDEDEGDEDNDAGAVSAREEARRTTRTTRRSNQDDDADLQSRDGLKPRTRNIIMAVAFAIGMYRIWAVLGPGITGTRAHDLHGHVRGGFAQPKMHDDEYHVLPDEDSL